MGPYTYNELAARLTALKDHYIRAITGSRPQHLWFNPKTGRYAGVPDNGPKPLSALALARVLDQLGHDPSDIDNIIP
jgi:hypothetical protein